MTVDIRARFVALLSGSGIEIGALNRPMVTHDGMKVRYVDRLSHIEQREHYPEFGAYDVTEPDIIDDAETLQNIGSGTQDFVIASHVIEHMRDPMTAIFTWLRVTREGGRVYIVVPHHKMIFDKHRETTSLVHLYSDYQRVFSTDWEHYLDYVENVDNLIHFGGVGTPQQLYEHACSLRSRDYSIHFHCFTPESFRVMLVTMQTLPKEQKFIRKNHRSYMHGDTEFHYLLEKA